ncbi:acyltransferase family protein [Cellvibrio sp. OA-2007]|uniref:acyltransferase family protein n=1 Tax=Cellvibrio sp. OA-2007 TaxID=529823 RepID=UPI000784BF2E|nr:acyltransferase [Cellvibrio sp. OA-2007]
MLGAYRTLLALLVVTQHLAGAHVLGAYAVFGFYCISGYLMTTVMSQSYGYSVKGVGRYLLNRFLRIYPLYWLSAFVSIILILTFSASATRAFHPDIYLPQDTLDTLRNTFIFFPQLESPRLTPPAWALTVELFFYLLIGVGLSRNKAITATWFVSSVAYHLFAAINSYGWDEIYFTVWAASLPFSTGAMIYHFRDFLVRAVAIFPKALYVPILLFIALPTNWWFASLGGYVRDIGFYINYLICALTISYLVSGSLPIAWFKHIDKKIGDLSYPIYLFHYQIGFLAMNGIAYLGFTISRGDVTLVLVSIPLIIFVAWLVVRWIEQPIMRVRERIKKGES